MKPSNRVFLFFGGVFVVNVLSFTVAAAYGTFNWPALLTSFFWLFLLTRRDP